MVSSFTMAVKLVRIVEFLVFFRHFLKIKKAYLRGWSLLNVVLLVKKVKHAFKTQPNPLQVLASLSGNGQFFGLTAASFGGGGV